MISLPGDAVRGIGHRPQVAAGLWTVILAAGGARRFGRLKLLRRIGTDSLLLRAVKCAGAVTGDRCVVVLGCGASRLRGELRGQPVRTVLNRRWRLGMAGSLQAALSALPASADAALVVLADQYAVDAQDLRRLARAWSREPARAAAAEINGHPSAPAILPRTWFPRVGELSGDEGARRLLRDAAVPPTRVPMPAAGLDLDAPQQLAAFRRLAQRNARPLQWRLAKDRGERYIR